MAQWYDQQILDVVGAAERPLRHREIAARIAPGNNQAWNQIGTSLTRLYRAGQLSRVKLDGHYWHYQPKAEAPAGDVGAMLALPTCPHAAHNAEIARLTAELAAERDRAEWLADKLAATDQKLDAARGAIESLRGLRGIAEAERDRARADAALLGEALSNASYLIARLCMELGYDNMLDADGVRTFKTKIETVLAAPHPGAPLLRLRDAARVYKKAVERDVLFGIADAEQVALFAALEEAEP